MKLSHLFGKTLRENPSDETAQNAILLERAGFIYKTMAGVYDYLPLGFRVLENIKRIIREEMNAIGGQEMLMTSLQPKERWKKTGRWEELGKEIMYQFKDRAGRETGIASTHEEAAAEIALRSVFSHKDLPFSIYQIQTKFRDELRAKSGLIRGREFIMKDLYSFHPDQNHLDRFYAHTIDAAYKKIFRRCGLSIFVTEASGGVFTKEFTHEYQVLSEAGEDVIFYCSACGYAQNREISHLKKGDTCPKCKAKMAIGKSIEVGNIFKLGTAYSEPMGLFFTDEKGEQKPVVMGSYGIGLGRLMGTIAEIHHDGRGIVWPASVAPMHVHLIELMPKDGASAKRIRKECEMLYDFMTENGIDALWDERDEKSAGEKFADADLIGIPWRVVVSERTLEKKGMEIKSRKEEKGRVMPRGALMKKLTAMKK